MDNKRIWEIDLLRAIAIILMVIFHMVYNLNELAGLNVNYQSGFWYWEGKVSALTFIFLAGISSGFSRNSVKRGIKVLVYAFALTAFTYIFFTYEYVRFGILHFLGTSMLLFPILKRLNNKLLFAIAIVIALISISLEGITLNIGLFIPLGITYLGFITLDYYPLIPYLSVFILGILAFKMYYYKKRSLFKFSYENKHIVTISRNSLAIYLIHQPIIIAAAYLIKTLNL